MYNFIGDNMKNKNKKQIIFWSVMIITFLSLAIILTTRELQNDTFYTIKVGQTIFNRYERTFFFYSKSCLYISTLAI